MKTFVLSILTLVLATCHLLAQTQICNITFQGASKQVVIQAGERVYFDFDYSTENTDGVYIHTIGHSGGSSVSGAANSGSPVLTGSGTRSDAFVTSNNAGTMIDEIWFGIYQSDNSTLIAEYFIPVEIHVASNVSVGNFSFSSDPKLSSLLNGENFSINANYDIDYPGGVRVFARPMTDGSLTPGYGASGAGITSGTGTLTQSFGFDSGTNIHVDAIRISIVSADQSVTIKQFFIPVNLYFSNTKITNINRTTTDFPFAGDDTDYTFDYSTTVANGVRIFLRPMTRGNTTPDYGASGSGIYTGSSSASSFYRINSGNHRVDAVRVQVYNDDQSELLLEYHMEEDVYSGDISMPITPCIPTPARTFTSNRIYAPVNFYNDTGDDIRVFFRPFKDGNPAPGYAANPSGLYPVGPNTETSGFFFTLNTEGHVDELRIQVTSADVNDVLAEFYYPADYTFGALSVDVQQTPEVLQAVTIYPNPANGNHVYVDFKLEKTQTVQISVTDIAGRQIQHLDSRIYTANDLQQQKISTTGFVPGMYLIQLQGEDWIHTEKFVRQ